MVIYAGENNNLWEYNRSSTNSEVGAAELICLLS